MYKKIAIAAFVSVALMGCQTTSKQAQTGTESGYGEMANAALMSAVQTWSQKGSIDNDIITAIQSSANISSEQAVGGVGSLLALAKNSLSSNESTELAGLMPGFDSLQSSGLTALISNNDTVKSAFSALGLDPALISTFTPIILSALQNQGASSGLLDSLSSIWK
ncbi:TPA: DUF2780 domain-containing protein [Vibrio vulnificus]|uniref:DUF2780 domain-containing protein n=1 Tax=Vibrio vulnificus TaxID=672 RepID=UPI000C9E7139|nr:DUF2780 domain-containing protein [Vibrio vulnificus]EGQ7757395.1 DUF2780 domain-containing protein [Vibrio vulnificus]EIO4105743.1 DUF2780 domain-containing protein [Vibrio vulnificus]EJC6744674.1 DUF2780 domain-containing protein [Vibrio vulnificus]EJC6819945.1 DUF2780 domain-containing protein [Vibrio vulnificus]EJC6953658.1 DUF2780 domain-containing protein [Vibrio vulnificus]